MELKWKIHKWDWNPTDTVLKAGEAQFSVMELKRGMLIGWVAVRITKAFTGATPTIGVGTTDDPDGFVSELDLGAMPTPPSSVAELYNGSGNYLNRTAVGYRQVWNQTQIDALGAGRGRIELSYTGHEDMTAGALSVIVVYSQIE